MFAVCVSYTYQVLIIVSYSDLGQPGGGGKRYVELIRSTTCDKITSFWNTHVPATHTNGFKPLHEIVHRKAFAQDSISRTWDSQNSTHHWKLSTFCSWWPRELSILPVFFLLVKNSSSRLQGHEPCQNHRSASDMSNNPLYSSYK